MGLAQARPNYLSRFFEIAHRQNVMLVVYLAGLMLLVFVVRSMCTCLCVTVCVYVIVCEYLYAYTSIHTHCTVTRALVLISTFAIKTVVTIPVH